MVAFVLGYGGKGLETLPYINIFSAKNPVMPPAILPIFIQIKSKLKKCGRIYLKWSKLADNTPHFIELSRERISPARRHYDPSSQ